MVKAHHTIFKSLPLDQLKECPSSVHRDPLPVEDELVADIAARGLLQPLCVRTNPGGNFYEVYAGRRRLEALRKIGVASVMCRIEEGLGDLDARVASFAENVNQRPMSSTEQCVAFHTVVVMCGGDVEEAARQVSASPAIVRAYNRTVNKLNPSLQDALQAGELPVETAVALAQKVSPEEQESVLNECGADNPEGVKEWAKDNQKKKPRKPKGPWIYDEQGEPLPIPEHLFGRVLALVRE